MKFTMPKASKKSLEKLLEYLGDTKNYSEYYSGNRAEDFKKCCDIESEWCWKYADLLLRGLKKRKLGYTEGHHGIPKAFYGVKRNSPEVDSGNWFVLSYGEHVWAHYCMIQCTTGKMRGKMARAFITMYRIGICKKRPLMPSEMELLDAIPEIELRRIQAMEPRWAKVEAEGRTHHCEDPTQFRRDYYEYNKDKILEQHKAYYESNKEKVAEWGKTYREVNKEKITERKKAYNEANKDKIAERRKAHYEANKEKHAEWMKTYRESNKEKVAAMKKAYWEANRDKLLAQKKVYWEANKEKIAEQRKVWRNANREKIAERAKAYREANKEKCAKRHKAYYEANKENLAVKAKAYREANKDKIAERQKVRYEANREKLLEKAKAYREANREIIAKKDKAFYDAKIAAGFRKRKNPVTGKTEWVFVGLPETKLTEVA